MMPHARIIWAIAWVVGCEPPIRAFWNARNAVNDRSERTKLVDDSYETGERYTNRFVPYVCIRMYKIERTPGKRVEGVVCRFLFTFVSLFANISFD